MLLNSEADPNATCHHNGLTPLHLAAQENHKKVVQLLLAKGADQSMKCTIDARAFTRLELAKRYKNAEIVQLLKKKNTDSTTTSKRQSAAKRLSGVE